MFVPFLIMLREGLEAALIVSLIASYLKRTQRGNWIGVMWVGVLLAAALCLGLGIFINETTGEFPQREQELFEGIVAVVAVCILTWMVFWMRKVSRNVKQQLEQAVMRGRLAAHRGQADDAVVVGVLGQFLAACNPCAGLVGQLHRRVGFGRPAVAGQASDGDLQRVGGGLGVAVEQPLRGVVGVGLGQAVGVALGGDLLPVGEVETNLE